MHRRGLDVDRGLVHATQHGCAPDADIAGAVHQVNAMTRTIAIVAIVLASTLAPAHALTSREWQDACESPDHGQQALCATYAAGVFDAMMFLQVTEPRTATTCYPTSPQPTAAQIVDVGIRGSRRGQRRFWPPILWAQNSGRRCCVAQPA